jgi:hypothetical protein
MCRFDDPDARGIVCGNLSGNDGGCNRPRRPKEEGNDEEGEGVGQIGRIDFPEFEIGSRSTQSDKQPVDEVCRRSFLIAIEVERQGRAIQEQPLVGGPEPGAGALSGPAARHARA